MLSRSPKYPRGIVRSPLQPATQMLKAMERMILSDREFVEQDEKDTETSEFKEAAE